MKKRLLSLLLVLTTAVSMCACNDADATTGDGTEAPSESGSETVSDEELSYEDQSALIYEKALGEFYTAYQAAEAEETVAERYALMAVAEAKLLESAVMLPLTTVGGRYSISKVAPYTVDNVLWGTDADRYHQALVCTEFIRAEDRVAMKEKYAELKGTGTYEE